MKIDYFELDLTDWRTKYHLPVPYMQTLSSCTSLSGLTSNPTCAVITAADDFKVRFTSTEKTFSFSFTMKNSPVAINTAVTDALCAAYTDSDYSV